jgi:hypothetical protein
MVRAANRLRRLERRVEVALAMTDEIIDRTAVALNAQVFLADAISEWVRVFTATPLRGRRMARNAHSGFLSPRTAFGGLVFDGAPSNESRVGSEGEKVGVARLYVRGWIQSGSASRQFDVGGPDHLAPFLSLLNDEVAELGGR